MALSGRWPRSRVAQKWVLPSYNIDCSPVWSALPDNCILRLQRSQNRAIRNILGRDYRSHVQPMLDDLKFLSISQRLQFNNCVLMWKVIHQKAPRNLSVIFTPMSERPSDRKTRSMSTMDVYRGDKVHNRSFKASGGAV